MGEKDRPELAQVCAHVGWFGGWLAERELGIFAVGGCGGATMGVHTGDWVRVDGGTGMVEALRRAWGSSV